MLKPRIYEALQPPPPRSTELFSYEDCIFYTVVTAVATLPRTQLKARVVDAPEILTVIDAIPNLAPFLTALYACDYKTLFQARPAPMCTRASNCVIGACFQGLGFPWQQHCKPGGFKTLLSPALSHFFVPTFQVSTWEDGSRLSASLH